MEAELDAAMYKELCKWINVKTAAAKKRAKEKGFEYSLDPSLLQLPVYCPILGIPLDYSVRSGTKTRKPRHNVASIDRIDSAQGYTNSNVRIISWRANSLRNNASKEELKALYLDSENLDFEHRLC